ncbi:MAG: FAD:protein FMN transferase [Saprospiraceae bacterium]|nr:FAD:protein FMN transferase [Saprospiraceae bacterium]
MRFSLIIVFTLIVIYSCQINDQNVYRTFQGETMGTTYSVICNSTDLQASAIDSILEKINASVSTYIDSSFISRINRSRDSIIALDTSDILTSIFMDNLKISDRIFRLTSGAFDPTVMPLVNLWGFGYAERERETYPDSSRIDSILVFTGLDLIDLIEQEGQWFLKKEHPLVELDFSAVAKGYAVDAVAEHIEKTGCTAYLVEIGGEVRCEGVNESGKVWTIGINVPSSDAELGDFSMLTELKDMSMATSGNYRNFYEIDGIKVSHSINPGTGYPERSPLLSASIVTGSCAFADAIATSCMILGLEASKTLIPELQEVEAYFIFGTEDGQYSEWMSEGFPESEKIK